MAEHGSTTRRIRRRPFTSGILGEELLSGGRYLQVPHRPGAVQQCRRCGPAVDGDRSIPASIRSNHMDVRVQGGTSINDTIDASSVLLNT
jgi:hypothetical protein